jgi:allantoinase
MSDFDLIIRNATPHPLIGIREGRIAALADGTADQVIDATRLMVFPGVIDTHVHFNEPGREDWEGISTGSQACAAGGTTTYFDMPLNSNPPVCDADAFFRKRALCEEKSHVDFALWGGLTPANLDHLEPLFECGVIALKAFMSHTGIDSFPRCNPDVLREGMKTSARLGLVVAVHAEIDHPELKVGTSVHDYLASRPVANELEAIRIALDLAGETGCRLHVVHVSSADGVRLIVQAASDGVNVTCETCPHYLALNQNDVERVGGLAKCAPPIRSEPERLALLSEVVKGNVNTIGSDHSPCPMEMKSDPDFFKVWGGIAGCQHLLTLLHDIEISPLLIARVTAGSPADRFGIAPLKGRITPGADADLVLFDPDAAQEIPPDALLYRHKISPYVGRPVKGTVKRTILRGRTVYHEGRVVGSAQGRMLKNHGT